MSYDIGFGGAYYAILPAKSVGLSVTKSSVKELINAGTMVSNKVKEQMKLTHPNGKQMEFLYGTILTDGNHSGSNLASNNITIFADKQVDRCPTGSGVIARMAVDTAKKLVKMDQECEFIGPTGSVFKGVVKKSGLTVGTSDSVVKNNCVRVQVTGSAYYTGTSRLYLEKGDSLGKGFLLR